MISADVISQYFGLNYRIIQRQIEGLTHADSLRQLPFRGNCLNWVLGHIVASRNNALILLGETPVWCDEEAVAYVSESEPITSGENAQRLEKIVEALNRSQEQITAALDRISSTDLETIAGERTVGEQLAGLYWHEAYHTGQTEYLRQLAGKNDKVI